jgi:hypothetical protein
MSAATARSELSSACRFHWFPSTAMNRSTAAPSRLNSIPHTVPWQAAPVVELSGQAWNHSSRARWDSISSISGSPARAGAVSESAARSAAAPARGAGRAGT